MVIIEWECSVCYLKITNKSLEQLQVLKSLKMKLSITDYNLSLKHINLTVSIS